MRALPRLVARREIPMRKPGHKNCSSEILEAEKISLRTLPGTHFQERESCRSVTDLGFRRAGAVNHDTECSGISRHGRMPACQKIAVAEYRVAREWRPVCPACLELVYLRESRVSVREFLGRPSPPQPRSSWQLRIKRQMRNLIYDIMHLLCGNPEDTTSATVCIACKGQAAHLIGTDFRRQNQRSLRKLR